MNRIISFAILIVFMFLLSRHLSFGQIPAAAEVTLILGFIILTAYIAGELFDLLHLPKMTGYLLTGLVFGPQLLHFISSTAVQRLKLIDSVAVGLISLSAGREMNFQVLKKYRAGIISISFWLTLLQICGVGLVTWYLAGFWQPLQVLPHLRLPFILILSLLVCSESPVTAIAILDETGIRNRFSYTVMGVIIVKGIILIVLFGLLISFIKAGTSLGWSAGLALIWRLLGSLGIGILLGWAISLYLQQVRVEPELFIILVAFLATEFAQTAGLESLLLCMSAGVFIENFSPQGESFLLSIKPATPLIYLIFFALAGARLDLYGLRQTGLLLLLLLILRTVFSQLGVALGSRLVEDQPLIRRYTWLGLTNQSGFTLALTISIGRAMPEIEPVITPISLAMIAATDFYAPTLFKWSLRKTADLIVD
ncbi:MAG: cation:proton antiporter [Candidatus Schekmanbacteria bacterium]|nr:cation:proton antiporter [Candidatus Schekmanbacteria bacterium]